MDSTFLDALALYGALFFVGISIGAMLHFAGGVAPIVHRVLEKPVAAELTRALFPIYYLILATLTGLGSLAAFMVNSAAGIVLLVIAGGFVFARQAILPQLDTLRADVARGSVTSKDRYDAMHAWSVRMNMLQLFVLLIVFWFLALSN